MTNPQLPPEGFRWVEPATDAESPGGPQRRAKFGPARRRSWWLAASIVLAMATVLVAVMVWHPWSGGTKPASGAAHPVAWPTGTPQDLLVPFPLTRQPVPGWRVTPAEIGLPARVHVGDMFASSGEKAYFVTTHCNDGPCSHPMGWVYGLNTGSGKPLFPPVAMDGFYGGVADCYGNGPSEALCVTEGYRTERPQLVWVIDLDHGAVTYTGQTDLAPQFDSTGGPQLRAVGNPGGETRLIATVANKGVYGVGSHAELTWFLPGSGHVALPNYLQVSDIPPMTLALQRRNPADESGTKDRVFSAADGKVLPPSVPAGTTLDLPAVYNGGFAYQYQQGGSQGVMFFDTEGREVARQEIGFAVPLENAALPTFVVNPQSQPEWLVFTGDGKQLVRIPGESISAEFQTIGNKLYIKRSPVGPKESWQQWDLTSGKPGPICPMHLGPAYVASDGDVVVFRDTLKDVAIDPSTCQTHWETPSEPDDARVVIWKVAGGLIGRTRQSDSVMSLRPAG